MKNKKGIGLSAKHGLYGYQFIMPFIIGLFLIFIPSIIQAFQYSFNNVRLTIEGLKLNYIAFDNFKRVFLVDTEFRVILLNAVQKTFVDVLVISIFSFFLAIILNEKFFGRSFARTVFFLPVILSTGLIASVETGDMMMKLFGSNTGSDIATGILSGSSVGIFNLKELLSESMLSPAIVEVILGAINGIYDLLNASGVQILIFLAGIQAISPSLFEASYVEGATMWESFWKITFPIMRPIMLVNVIYTIIDTYTRPSYGMLSFIQQIAFEGGDMGYASALSIIYFLVIAVFIFLVWLIIGRKMSYTD